MTIHHSLRYIHSSKFRAFLVVCLLLAQSVSMTAQSLFQSMLPQTAKVMFIDSTVVDKNNFLQQIPLNPESGLLTTYSQFFGQETPVPCGLYRNEFGNRCYFALGDTINGTALYSTDKLGDTWAEPHRISEFEEEWQDANYPFLMSDGFTLLFAAKGDYSLGGYDIFLTMFDNDGGTYFRPENYGLPFNSTANDYLVAFDEIDSLGWLVSDRYQPEGKVCIYTFVPTFPREAFRGSIDDDKLQRYANLNSIKETWGFGDRDRAMARLQAMLDRQRTTGITTLSKGIGMDDIPLVIDDNTVYYQSKDFLSPTARKLYDQYKELSMMVMLNEKKLESQREAFSSGDAKRRAELRQPILRLEHDIETQKRDMKDLEKKIRNAEKSVEVIKL